MSSAAAPLYAAEVARLQEARQARSCADLADEVLWIAGGAACYSASTDWLNKAFGVGLGGAVTHDEIDHLVDFWDQRAVPGSVELCPYAHPSFVVGLGRAGFSLLSFEQVFVRPLPKGEDLRAAHPHGWPPGLEIVRVDPDDDLRVEAFCRVTTSGLYGTDRPDGEALRVARRMAREPRNDSLLALRGGEPVGGGTVEVAGPIACLYGASVLPAARRHGVQAALVLARLERARERGARMATIESAPGNPTERNAVRLGFQGAYTKALMARPTPA